MKNLKTITAWVFALIIVGVIIYVFVRKDTLKPPADNQPIQIVKPSLVPITPCAPSEPNCKG